MRVTPGGTAASEARPSSRAWRLRDELELRGDDDRPRCWFCLGERELSHDRACPTQPRGRLFHLERDAGPGDDSWQVSRRVPAVTFPSGKVLRGENASSPGEV